MATRTSAPTKVATRLKDSLKRFQPVLSSALARDVNESDTAAIVADLLAELFGYDKYHEVTSEHMIRGTYSDLAVTIEGKLRLLVEVKAIGLDLKEKHLRQAANYAANQGCEWVALTNGVIWQVYRMDFGQHIKEELVLEVNLLELNLREAAALDCLYLLTREGLMKGALPDYYVHKQATNRFVLGALIVSDPVVAVIRRELKKVSPNVKVSADQVREVIMREVLKREVAEGEKAEEARKKVARVTAREAREKERCEPEPVGSTAAVVEDLVGPAVAESTGDPDVSLD
jgi:predicted type IV restriction endonuclease